MKKILPLFSYLFHPIFIPILAACCFLYYNSAQFNNQEIGYVLFQVAMFTIFIPAILFVLLRRFGKIDSIMIVTISQRKIPLILHCFLLIFLVRNSITLERYPALHFFFLGALLATIFALILLFFNVKASLHTLASSGLTVFVIALGLHLEIQNPVGVFLLILANGLVASSRIEMNAHTKKELIIGFLLGGISQLLLLFLWL